VPNDLPPDYQKRELVTVLRAQGLPITEIALRLGRTRQARGECSRTRPSRAATAWAAPSPHVSAQLTVAVRRYFRFLVDSRTEAT
jgi:hypothetical protein